MYLNVYIPSLQCENGVAKFFRSHRGHPFASSALMDPMTKSFVAGMERFAKQEQIPVVQFRKGQRKDDVMAEHLARFDKPEGVVLLAYPAPDRNRSRMAPEALAPALRCILHECRTELTRGNEKFHVVCT